MNEGTIAAFLGILVGVWLLRTAVPYFLKQHQAKRRGEAIVFDLKFVLTGLVSTAVASIPLVIQQVQLFVIVEGVHPGWVFLGAMLLSWGLSDGFNRFGITAWLPEQLRTILEAQPDED